MKRIVWIFALPALVLAGCQSAPWLRELHRYDFSEPHMGTLFHMTLYAPVGTTAKLIAQAAFRRVTELERVMSDYDPDSELSRLCAQRAVQPVQISDDLLDILLKARRFSELTDGAFDVTIGPQVQLWRRARRQRALPNSDELATATAAVGFRNLTLLLPAKSVMMEVPGMRLDLGGIAKGYAADQALAVLRRCGIRQAMVAAGGDLALGDAPPGRTGWNIGISSIDAAGKQLTRVVLLENCGVSTSGDTEQFVVINGVRFSHIVNPATGLGLTGRIGVTILAPDATTSDALATGVSVMGVTRGLALVEELPGIAALIVTVDDHGKKNFESTRFQKLSAQ